MTVKFRFVFSAVAALTVGLSARARDLAGVDHEVTTDELAANTPFTNSSATPATLTFNLSEDATYAGTISGPIKVKKMGLSTLTLTAASTYTGGTEVSGGDKGTLSILLVQNGDALGTGAVSLPYGYGQLKLSASVRVTNEVNLVGSSSSAGSHHPHLYLNDGSSLAGPIVLKRKDANNATYPLCGNGTVYIDGEIRPGDAYGATLRIYMDSASNNVRIRKAVNFPLLGIVCQDKGRLWLDAEGNIFGAINANGANELIHTTVDGALSPVGSIGYGSGSGANSCFCLDGHDQAVAKVYYRDYTTINPGVIMSTNAPATLTVSGDVDSLVRARLNGLLSLCFNPLTATRELVIDGNDATRYTHTMSGTLAVSNGVVSATTVTFTALSGVVVAEGARFELAGTTVLNALSVLDLAANAVFLVPDGVQVMTDKLLVNGLQKAMGVVYVSKDNPNPPEGAVALDELSGNGSVYVNVHEIETVESTWTGADGDDLTTLSKWNPTIKADDLTSGGLIATFPRNGGSAVFSSDIVLKKLVFSSAASETPGFSLAAQGSATLTLREGGISISGAGTYRINAPLSLLSDQTWAFPAEGGATLVVTGDISAPSQYYGLGFAGSPDVVLAGSDSSFEGPVTISNGTLRAIGCFSLGRGNARSIRHFWPGQVVLDGVHLEKPYAMTGDKAGNSNPPVILTMTNDVVMAECFGNTYACGMRLSPEATLALDGGMSLSSYFAIAGASDSVYYATNVPLTASAAVQVKTAGRFVVGVASNVIERGDNLASLFLSSGILETRVPEALATTNKLFQIRFAGGTLDLCGNDQICGGINPDQYKGDANSVVTSETPASLTVAQWNDFPYRGDFAGKAGLVKRGSATLTLSKAIASTGDFSVFDGCLAFDATGSWKGASAVTVSGPAARLSLAGAALGRQAELSVSDGATVEIAAGVVQTVSAYVYEGRRIGAGVFTAADNVGVTGEGSLRVRGGLLLMFR